MILYQADNSVHAYNIDTVIYNDFTYIPHLHRDLELVYVMEGTLDANIDGNIQRLSRGDFCLILQNQVHGFETPVSSKVWVCVFAEDYARDFAAAVNGYRCADNLIRMEPRDRLFLEERLVSGSPDRLEHTALLSLACAEFYKNRTFTKANAEDDRLFHKILKYVNEHYTENITQRDMARVLGYEPHYLSRYFNRFFGRNFRQFLHEYRINYARQLMAKGDKNLSEISLECGFQSHRSFNRAYRALENEEPRQTRRRILYEK